VQDAHRPVSYPNQGILRQWAVGGPDQASIAGMGEPRPADYKSGNPDFFTLFLNDPTSDALLPPHGNHYLPMG
jgi:hypothetical protein